MLEVNVRVWSTGYTAHPLFEIKTQPHMQCFRSRRPDKKMCAKRASTSKPSADVGIFHLIHLAMQRRGLAAEITGVMSFCAHERIKRLIMGVLVEECPSNHHYAKSTLEHSRNTDKFLEILLPKTATREPGWRVARASCAGLSTGQSARERSPHLSCCRCPNTTGGTEEEGERKEEEVGRLQ